MRRDNTPTLFEPNVADILENTAQPIPAISPVDLETPKFGIAQPAPPPDPLGEVDPEKSRRFTLGSAVNALWKAVRSGDEAGKTVEGWSKVIATLGPNVVPILEWLRSVLYVVRALASVPFRRYLRLEGLRSGAPDLILGCVTDGGSLAGKVSASSRSSWFCWSLREVSCFGFLSALVFAFGVMVRSLLGGRPPMNEPDRQPFPPPAAARRAKLLNRHWRQHAVQQYDGMWFSHTNTGSSNDLLLSLGIPGRRFFCCCRIYCWWSQHRLSSYS